MPRRPRLRAPRSPALARDQPSCRAVLHQLGHPAVAGLLPPGRHLAQPVPPRRRGEVRRRPVRARWHARPRHPTAAGVRATSTTGTRPRPPLAPPARQAGAGASDGRTTARRPSRPRAPRPAAAATAPSRWLKPSCRAAGRRAARGRARAAGRRAGQLGGQPRLHQRGDAGAAQHRADLPGGVVDPGPGAGLVHRQVAGGGGADRRPHEAVGDARAARSAAAAARSAASGVITSASQTQRDGEAEQPDRRRCTAGAPGRSAGRRTARARRR